MLVTVGYQHSPREKIFEAVIDQVEVKRVKDLSPRDIEHDNPEFRRIEEMVHFLEQIYGRKVDAGRHRHRRALLARSSRTRRASPTPAAASAAPRTSVSRSSLALSYESANESLTGGSDAANMHARWHSHAESAKPATTDHRRSTS